jgi:hypothetical protein
MTDTEVEAASRAQGVPVGAVARPLKTVTSSQASETKREAFKRLAERRTNAAMDRIRVIGNLSNRNAYEYSDEDVRAIFAALEQELKVTRAKFQSARRRAFKLG